MILTLIARLLGGRYAEYDWEAEIEIDESASLDDLHQTIFKAIRFWDDAHLYKYFIAKSIESRDRRYVADIGQLVDDLKEGEQFSIDIPLSAVFPPPEKYSLFYVFDLGDEWTFKILKSRKPPKEPSKRCKYPRVVSTKGKRPKQYVYDAY